MARGVIGAIMYVHQIELKSTFGQTSEEYPPLVSISASLELFFFLKCGCLCLSTFHEMV